jgi:hypothetical protein
MVASLMGFGVHTRPLRVPVPAFPDSDLPGVDSRTESRTVYLSVLLQDAEVHGPGMQVDAAVECVLCGVASPEVSSS